MPTRCCDFILRVYPMQRLVVLFLVCTYSLAFGLVSSASDSGFKNVRIRLVNGSSIRATVESIDAEGNISGSKILKDFRLGQITSINTGRKQNPSDGKCNVKLKLGGNLIADSLLLDQDQVSTTRMEAKIQIPISAVRAVVWRSSEKVIESLENPSGEYDYVIVSTKRGEQRVKGFLESITQTHVIVDYQGQSRKISLDKVLAVVVADLGNAAPQGIKANVSLVDGSKVVGAIKSFRDDNLEIAISESYSLDVAAQKISQVIIRSDRISYLSDVDPIRYEEQTQFAASRQWQRDASLLGNPIRLKYDSTNRVLTFDKGIGTRSYTSLVFRNDNSFNNLRAVVGIDMETAGQGDCEMVIEGDGIRLWSKRVKGSDDPEPIVVDIDGISEIALIVLPGANFDLADHADWADVRFTKSE